MRVRIAAWAAVLSGALVGGPAGAGPLAGGDPPDGLGLPDGPRRSKAFLAAVNMAIDRGVEWLRDRQGPDGAFELNAPVRNFRVGSRGGLGPTALGLYTLRACGAPFDDPAVQRGFRRLREIHDADRKSLDNYGVSLTVLALEAHHASESVPGTEGNRYGPGAAGRRRIPQADLEWIRELARWLAAAQTRDGGFSYGSPAQGSTFDNSNGQFSLLALKAASRCGVEIPAGVWRKGLDHFRDKQETKGPAVGRFVTAGVDEEGYGSAGKREVAKDRARGWGYVSHSLATGSMTAGGVSSLVICRSELLGSSLYNDALDRKVVQDIRDGIAWLGHHFTVAGNPGPAGAPPLRELWHYYYLYGLERAGVLSGVPFFGEHDWYLEGATYLLEEQRDNGSWLGQAALDAVPWDGAGPDAATANYLDTCFALLFLKRATFRVDRGAVATEAGEDRLDLSGAADLDEDSFAAVFDAVFRRFARAAGQERAARAADFVRMGPRALPRLILRLDGADEEERAAAADALQRTTGETRGYRADAAEADRSDAVAAWEAWWFRGRDRIRADGGTGRFTDAPEKPE